MVEFFGEKLQGFLVTKFGWVQSYGSRAVKPPVIYGDVKWTAPLTVKETVYAQSLTDKPVKGMLTGPVTILNWSFERVDVPRKVVQDQIALAIDEEVLALEEAGISVIQVDEPALREGLPLRSNSPCTSTSKPISSWILIQRAISFSKKLLYSSSEIRLFFQSARYLRTSLV